MRSLWKIWMEKKGGAMSYKEEIIRTNAEEEIITKICNKFADEWIKNKFTIDELDGYIWLIKRAIEDKLSLSNN